VALLADEEARRRTVTASTSSTLIVFSAWQTAEPAVWENADNADQAAEDFCSSTLSMTNGSFWPRVDRNPECGDPAESIHIGHSGRVPLFGGSSPKCGHW